MRTRQKRELQQKAHCDSIPCECGRNYSGESSTTLAARIREHKHNLKDSLIHHA
jgi:hypothetical protein